MSPEDVAPDVDAFELYTDAFSELSTCRPSAFGVSAIPFSAIVEYSKVYEVGDFEEFLYLIRRMDGEFLRLENEKSKAKEKAGNNGNGKTGKGNQSRR